MERHVKNLLHSRILVSEWKGRWLWRERLWEMGVLRRKTVMSSCFGVWIYQRIPTSQRWRWNPRRRWSAWNTTRRMHIFWSAASTMDRSFTGTHGRVLSRLIWRLLSTAIVTRHTRSSGYRQRPALNASQRLLMAKSAFSLLTRLPFAYLITLVSLWPWPRDLDMWPWPRYSEDVPAYQK